MAGRRRTRGGRGGREGRDRRERGVSTVEVVILTPGLILFALAMVGLAFYAQNVSQVQDAASDAARMASLQADPGMAATEANQAAVEDLADICDDGSHGSALSVPTLKTSSVAGGGATVTMLAVTVQCKASYFGYSYTITETAYAPVDTFGGERP